MSQNDMSIANASGATVRADITSALQALASNNSGTSAPGTTYPCQHWFDETNNLLKIRDEANANWVNIASLVGTTWIPYSNGSVLGTLANQNAAAIGADLVMSAKAFKGALATVASASNVNLDTAAGNNIDLTGTTTITAFTIAAGALYFVRYTGGGLTLTHNATTLVLPTAANITAATGDTFLVYGKATNEAVILVYQRASGAALVGATTAADQTAMEAAASNTAFVTPLSLKWSPHAVKAEFVAEMVGTHSITRGVNTASVTDNGVGLATLTWTLAFSGTSYSSTGFVQALTASNYGHLDMASAGTNLAGSRQFRATMLADASTPGIVDEADPSFYCVQVCGDQ
jgi:hypothetical protein